MENFICTDQWCVCCESEGFATKLSGIHVQLEGLDAEHLRRKMPRASAGLKHIASDRSDRETQDLAHRRFQGSHRLVSCRP